MKVLIVDDEPLAREELRYLVADHPAVEEVLEADGVAEANTTVNNQKPDLVFLDIKLGDGNGMALAKRWKRASYQPAVIFATAYDQYALDAFEADALDYILKPFDEDRVQEAIDRVLRVHGQKQVDESVNRISSQENPRLSVMAEDLTIVISKEELCYLEAQSGNVYLHLINGKEVVSRQTLTSLTEQLSTEQFLQVHRSYVVNLNQISILQPATNHTYELTMINGDKVPVSRSFVGKLKVALGLQ
ncbi:LytTR family DNA-binding domain-containing protein [Lactobacillus sp. 3B(2020)]|uniref:LytR/AlgR family response regulator transcription factor n=1 Tax=Lactobacillus sp. 3B(2020) TaxID=2695882 RepID=UPI0015DFA8B6|nr:LytTR family DNA-binding domain-containing protein [Lactobacillus sp. 3B(2020)]QLL70057.1 response regulator [Lactobacillus sp. 3B(2020)]